MDLSKMMAIGKLEACSCCQHHDSTGLDIHFGKANESGQYESFFQAEISKNESSLVDTLVAQLKEAKLREANMPWQIVEFLHAVSLYESALSRPEEDVYNAQFHELRSRDSESLSSDAVGQLLRESNPGLTFQQNLDDQAAELRHLELRRRLA
jgi:hypothetical protein